MSELLRQSRIFDQTSRKANVAAFDDSGISGPKGGLRRPEITITKTLAGGANAVVGLPGLLTICSDIVRNRGVIANVTFSRYPHTGIEIPQSAFHRHTRKYQIATVEAVVNRLERVDAIAVHVNTRSQYRDEMVATLRKVKKEATEHKIPVIAFMYPRGEKGDDDDNYLDLRRENPKEYARYVREAVQLGVDEGADGIKTMYTGDRDSFHTVIETAGDIPVFVAGESRVSNLQFLTKTEEAMNTGASGAITGRNFFNHPEARKMVYATGLVIHQRKKPKEAMRLSLLNPNS
jgi:fructose-bisphosphate aldolase / 2-amino-3,7-dideoxy-D-threo-hept-6-ulosonate synthase